MNDIFAAFLNSLRGLRDALTTERAVRQEAIALLVGVFLTPFVAATLWQAAALLGSILLVLSVELLNTAIEKLCDHVTPERHEVIRYVKDLGSAAVLCALAIAGMVWLAALHERLFG